jgi:hypothetical protein
VLLCRFTVHLCVFLSVWVVIHMHGDSALGLGAAQLLVHTLCLHHLMLCGRAADLLAQASASFPPSICHSLAYGSVPMSRESHALAHDVEHAR